MIIKTAETQQNPVIYEIYDTITAETPDGKTAQILSLKDRVTVEECSQRIAQINREIENLELEQSKYQTYLDEINNL